MDKITLSKIIHGIENEKTTKVIGLIDINVLESYVAESLYYTLPLIERIILEIFKLDPVADIEKVQQGIMRTPMEIIKGNTVIPEKTIELINKYFEPDGLRNKIFHPTGDILTLEIDFNEINYIIMSLMYNLLKQIEKYSDIKFNKIEKL